MKNNFTKAILFLPLFFLLAGRASAKKAQFDADEISPACVMAINFNKTVDWEPDKKTKKPTSSKKEEETSETIIYTAPLFETAEGIVYEEFEKLQIGFFDKNVLLSSKSYSSATDESFLLDKDLQKIAGFFLLSPNNRHESKIAEELSADYFIYVTFTINKVMKSGTLKRGKIAASVTATIEISDGTGRIVKSGSGYAKSANTLSVKDQSFNVSDFQGLCMESIRDALILAIEAMQ